MFPPVRFRNSHDTFVRPPSLTPTSNSRPGSLSMFSGSRSGSSGNVPKLKEYGSVRDRSNSIRCRRPHPAMGSSIGDAEAVVTPRDRDHQRRQTGCADIETCCPPHEQRHAGEQTHTASSHIRKTGARHITSQMHELLAHAWDCPPNASRGTVPISRCQRLRYSGLFLSSRSTSCCVQ